MKSFSYSTADEFFDAIGFDESFMNANNEVEKKKLGGSKMTLNLTGSCVKLYRHTRAGTKDSTHFLPNTRNTKIIDGSSYVQHGYFIERMAENKWKFESWTIDQGCHVLNFSVMINDDGIQLDSGQINYFGLGMSVLNDQSYVTKQLKAQLKESKQNVDYWDLKQ